MLDIRYGTSHNFIGRPITGYRQPLCIITRRTANALIEARASVRAKGYALKVYDCYRPQRAVDDFVGRWWPRASSRWPPSGGISR